jgi:hypothetical protein
MMSHSRGFIGHITVYPPLNLQEQKYLHVFSGSWRYRRRGGGHEFFDFFDGLRGHRGPYPPCPPSLAAVDAQAIPGASWPDRWCQWVPSCNGRCITHSGDEGFHAPTAWLRLVIDRLLRARSALEAAGSAQFDAFTFDHVCNGLVAACQGDTGTPFLIRVTDNAVTEEALVDDDLEGEVWRQFGYETELDRRRALRTGGGRRRLAHSSRVVPLRLAAEADRE